MKTSTKIILGQFIVIVLLILLLSPWQSCREKTYDPSSTAEQIARSQDSIQYLIDQLGQRHAQVRLLQTNLSTARIVFAKTLAQKEKELKISGKRVHGITNVTIVQKLNIDSLIAAYEEQRLQDTLHLTDSIPYYTDVYITDSLSITEYSKRLGFLKSVPMIDVVSYNNATTVTRISGFAIKSRQSNLNFGPTVNVLYYDNRFRILPGLGLQWRLAGIRLGK